VTPVVVALGAAVAALLLVLVLLLSTMRRLRHTTDQRVASAVGDLNSRMEAMVGELRQALERANDEGRRNRFLGNLAASLDLDDVLTRTLEAALAVTGADAAMLSMDDPNGSPLIATLGLSADEAERQAIGGPPDGRDVRSVTIGYRYTDAELERSSDLIHGGVAVPVSTELARVGMLAVFTRAAGRPISDDRVLELEELADRAGPAIENARRFREARKLADLDALTNLHNRRYFHETLAREVSRAHRYDRRLALIVFDVDDFKAVNDRIGHLSGDAVLAEVAERVRSVVRSADVACRIGGDEFAVILPESSVVEARQLSERLQETVAARPIVHAGRLDVSAGVAELQQNDDASSLFESADEALYRAKEAGKGRVVTAHAQAETS
jgi:diguanylate cyclase (GGDEF)-like protein